MPGWPERVIEPVHVHAHVHDLLIFAVDSSDPLLTYLSCKVHVFFANLDLNGVAPSLPRSAPPSLRSEPSCHVPKCDYYCYCTYLLEQYNMCGCILIFP